MNIFINILVILSISIFWGCTEHKPRVKHVEKILPEWYTTPPLNTDKYLYGVGSGDNRERVISSALENLISKLGISVASSYKSNSNSQTGYREYISKTTNFDIQSEVDKIRISNYEIISIEKLKYNHYVTIVRSDKQLFKHSLLTSLNQIYESIETKKSNINNANVLLRYNFYRESSKALLETLSTLLVLSSIDRNFDNKEYLNKIQTINSEFDLLQKKVTLFFPYLQESQIFTNVVKSSLNDMGIAISPVSKDDKNQLKVYVTHKINKAFSNGFFIARASVTIDVKDYKYNTINTQVINTIGHSIQSMEIAINDASQNFKNEMEKKYIFIN